MATTVEAWREACGLTGRIIASSNAVHLFSETGSQAVTSHSCPAWKVVLPVDGVAHAVVRGRSVVSPHGLLVAPNVENHCRVTNGHIAIFVDAWRTQLPEVAEYLRLDAGEATTLQQACGSFGAPDLDSVADALHSSFGLRVVRDGFTDAVDDLADTMTLASVSRHLSLSPSRTRAVVRARVGAPLSSIRHWHRLRHAVAALQGSHRPASAALASGFADQSHLTRVAKAQLGRTPASLHRVA